MLRHDRGLAPLLALVLPFVLACAAPSIGFEPVVVRPAPSGAPPGTVAEAAGLAVAYDPARGGLTVLTTAALAAPAPGDGAARAVPGAWREVAFLEPRALIGTTWEMPMAPAQQSRVPTPVVRQEAETVIVYLDGLEIGTMVRSSWSLTLSRTAPVFTLDRVDTLLQPREVGATALAVTGGPTALSDRLVLVNGTAYTLAEGGLDRLGNHGLSGLVHRNPALTITATSGETTRVRGDRLADRDLVLLTIGRAAGATGTTIQSRTRFFLGERTPLQQASSTFQPDLETFLLTAGYYGNIFVSDRNGRVLTASMLAYSDSVWMRDVGLSAACYAYVLDDTSVLRNTLVQFLRRTTPDGVVPEYFNEAGLSENRGAWDAMPDLIHGVYAYVSKSRDVGFVNEHLTTLLQVIGWIERLDTDGDGLPDQDIAPFGYYDSVENGVMHTYAIASFHAAYLELAELLELAGRDAAPYRERAERMRLAFNRPLAEGGYWQPELGYPIAWKKADGRVVTGFETFGVLLAIRARLITDKDRLERLAGVLRDRRAEFLNQNAFPSRLMLGGYDRAYLRPGVPPERAWMLDANAPWVTGAEVAVRARLGATDDAAYLLSRYQDAALHYPPMSEFGAAPGARYGPGESHDGGRLWDNAAWFDAVYGTHYGLRMTPRALHVQPHPLRRVKDDSVEGVSYQGMRFRLTLNPDGYSLTVLSGTARTVVFYPSSGFQRLSVNGSPQQLAQTIMVRPGETFTIVNYGAVASRP